MTNQNIKIPEGWTQIQLGKLFFERPKSRIKVEDAFLGGQYPFFTSGEKILSRNDYLVDGSNLFLATGGVANVKFYNNKASCSADTYCIATKDDNVKLFFYYLQHNLSYINYHFFEGSGLKHLQKSDFKKHQILLPKNPKEQQKIVEMLTAIDEAIDKAEALIQKCQRIKHGLMQNLLTKGIDENGNIRSEKTHKFKDSPLGRIPEEWEVNPIGKECKQSGGSIQTGPFGSQLHAKDYKENGIPIITVEHLAEGKILHQNLPLVGEADYRRLRKYVLKYGDLVFSRVGAIDRCSFTSYKEEGWLFSGRCLRVRGGSRFDAKFLSYLLNYDTCKQWILNNAVGSTMKCLNTTILSNLPIKMPTLPEQSRIASILSQADETIQKEETYKQKLLSLKSGLMEDLLTGKVRVVNHLLN